MKITKEQKIKLKQEFSGVNRKELAKLLVRSGNRNLIDAIASGHKIVSALRARQIERLTGGQVKASTLRPDIFD